MYKFEENQRTKNASLSLFTFHFTFTFTTSWVGGRQRRLRVAWAQNVQDQALLEAQAQNVQDQALLEALAQNVQDQALFKKSPNKLYFFKKTITYLLAKKKKSDQILFQNPHIQCSLISHGVISVETGGKFLKLGVDFQKTVLPGVILKKNFWTSNFTKFLNP